MSHKRKLKEFHDPDYPINSDNKKKCVANLSHEEKLQKIRAIVEREFSTEIDAKEQEIMAIENKLTLAKKLLKKVRYAVVYDYYSKKCAVHSDSVRKNVADSMPFDILDGDQKSIHPAVKKIFGENWDDYTENLKVMPPRKAAKIAKDTIKNKICTKKKKTLLSVNSIENNCLVSQLKTPRYLEPTSSSIKIPQINNSRGGNKYKHIIVVGNTSKYLGDDDSTDGATHKWLIYLQTKSLTPIESIVSKVRFFLHPSYKPNDVIDVSDAPFQLAKRGWGEFPIRLQIFFHSSIKQKPVQLIHNLVLDKSLSGLQTMGAETVVELWLPIESPNLNESSNIEKTHDEIKIKNEIEDVLSINDNQVEQTEFLSDDFFELLNKIEDQSSKSISIETDNIEPTISFPLIEDKCWFHKKDDNCLVSNEPEENLYCQKPENNSIDKILENNFQYESETFDFLSSAFQENNELPPLVSDFDEESEILNSSLDIFNDDKMQVNPQEEIVKNSVTEQDLDSLNILNRKYDNCLSSKNLLENLNKNTTTETESCAFINGYKQTENNWKNNVFHKNGKMYIIDPLQTKIKQERKRQESLLKPQVSLLKNSLRNGLKKNLNSTLNERILFNINNDHDYSPLIGKSPRKVFENNTSLVAVSSPNNSKENILVKVNNISSYTREAIMKNLRKSAKNKKKINYKLLLQKEFLKLNFEYDNSGQNAVEFLLKKLPIINQLASDSYYRHAFPFVLDNEETFNSYPSIKQKSIEWLRAKAVEKILKKNKNIPSWTTKEILIFARQYAFTPVIKIQNESLSYNLNQTNISTFNDIIKKEIKREKSEYQTLTLVDDVRKWIDSKKEILKNLANNNNDIINVIDSDDEPNKSDIKSNIKQLGNKYLLPIDRNSENEVNLVCNWCEQIGIRLKPEEIVPDVMHATSQLILVEMLRCFIEDLVRRAASNAFQNNENSFQSGRSIGINDIKEAILSKPQFDFLTNKYLGIKKTND